jgi:MoaA/NifB/PqqE/SkfB family radical SAM enzyme
MSTPYAVQDFVHYTRWAWRDRRRQRRWAVQFEKSVRSGSFKLPTATMVQLLPTEACNLRCAMCNQWGENGYFLAGVRKPHHMEAGALTKLMRGLSPRDTMISVHGGEPFAYRHTETLLDLLAEQQFDVIFSTNGTLLDPHLDRLARIENLMLLLSIDGDETVHDSIRGEGCYRQAKDSLRALFQLRRKQGMPLPAVFMNFVVCEWNTEAIAAAYEAARDLGVVAINYNMRWFLTEEIGKAYERHLKVEFGITSSGAWRGWLSNEHERHDYSGACEALRRTLHTHRWRLRPPYVITTPRRMQGRDFEAYYADYTKVFGNDSCFMPFYWARIHANGDLIYCPGHPDVIAGNVFRDGFREAFNSEVTIRFRRYILNNRLPICNRCCGLYMTDLARPFEQRSRKRLGLTEPVRVHLPQ